MISRIEAIGETLSGFEGTLSRWPLAVAELWHRDPPRTTQRAVGRILADPNVDAVLCSGGTGSGKTELGAMVAVAVAAGRRERWARQWAEVNGFPLSRLPDRPGRVIASALTSNDSRRVQRTKAAAYLPAGTQWKNEDGHGEAEAQLPNGGVIVFKSNDQGRRSYQGDWADMVWPDEEHDADVMGECLMRVARVPGGQGFVLCTMTPLKGFTWVHQDFIAKPKPGYAAFWIWGDDNPYLPAEKMERALSTYGPHEQAARRRGEFTSLEGRVYPQFARHIHIVPSFRPPDDWPRFRSIDFGTSNPFCCLWAALDTSADVLHIYREHYQAGWTDRQHADHIKLMSKGEPEPLWTVADPAAAGSRLSFAVEHGLPTLAAHKDIRDGINVVSERLNLDAMGRPRLLIHDCCVNHIREKEGYVWAKRQGPSDDPDVPLKADDHGQDCERYLCVSVRDGLRLAAA